MFKRDKFEIPWMTKYQLVRVDRSDEPSLIIRWRSPAARFSGFQIAIKRKKLFGKKYIYLILIYLVLTYVHIHIYLFIDTRTYTMYTRAVFRPAI